MKILAKQNLLNSALNVNIKNWYRKTYPDDTLGYELYGHITFADMYELYQKDNFGDNFYKFLGVQDSTIRERCFQKLSDLTGVSYREIYNKWLEN